MLQYCKFFAIWYESKMVGVMERLKFNAVSWQSEVDLLSSRS